MGIKCGIVGLPNVGKSTLFNALTRTAAAATANYPFCTVEPNIGRVPVPDPRIAQISALSGATELRPAQLEFVDIAGLVAGASRGEGLGNKFLGHIREVDAIIHLCRCFADSDISHVSGAIDPLADIALIETELMLADLETVERRLEPMVKRARGGEQAARKALPVLERLAETLRAGKPARETRVDETGQGVLRDLHLLTVKPILYVCNVDEASAATGNDWSALVAERAEREGVPCVIISAAIEAEIAQLTDAEEQRAFLDSIGVAETGLTRLIRAAFRLLDLITFFTGNDKRTDAWTAPAGTLAPQAAGRIHTDFERGFIRAEIISFADLIASGGEQAAREAGKMRLEGRDYAVRDGDIVHFRFNV